MITINKLGSFGSARTLFPFGLPLGLSWPATGSLFPMSSFALIDEPLTLPSAKETAIEIRMSCLW